MTGIWEVLLHPRLMAKVRRAAEVNGVSMSWVVRYCVFRLARKKVVDLEKLHALARSLREKNQEDPLPSNKLCRLNVCLYGDDERLFCELKYRFRLTTTMVVRVALVRYLDLLLARRVPYWRLFWYGIKFVLQHFSCYSTAPGFPVVDFHIKRFFDYQDYWAVPSGNIPFYLRYFSERLTRS
ncbi:MAG: hypothetical protein NZM25_00280 [Leptospiraceae bacterium]|nr:hypothetical protein [Leptospiraceae bacterium]